VSILLRILSKILKEKSYIGRRTGKERREQDREKTLKG